MGTTEDRIKWFNDAINATIKTLRDNGKFRNDFELDESARLDLLSNLETTLIILQTELGIVGSRDIKSIMGMIAGGYVLGYDSGIKHAEGK